MSIPFEEWFLQVEQKLGILGRGPELRAIPESELRSAFTLGQTPSAFIGTLRPSQDQAGVEADPRFKEWISEVDRMLVPRTATITTSRIKRTSLYEGFKKGISPQSFVEQVDATKDLLRPDAISSPRLAPAKQQANTGTLAPSNCIVCGHVDVARVSAIVAGGTWSTRSQSVGGALTLLSDGAVIPTVGMSEGKGMGQTELARRLSLPRRESAQGGAHGCFGLVAGLLAVFIAIPISLEYGPFLGVLIGLVGVIVVVAIIVHLMEQRRELDASDQHYWQGHQLRLETWHRLYYCPKCDTVFDPQSGQSARSANSSALL